MATTFLRNCCCIADDLTFPSTKPSTSLLISSLNSSSVSPLSGISKIKENSSCISAVTFMRGPTSKELSSSVPVFGACRIEPIERSAICFLFSSMASCSSTDNCGGWLVSCSLLLFSVPSTFCSDVSSFGTSFPALN
eukprot:Lithocolla_globosa_v1_NODE_1259_length_2726_cov_7.700112.p3 type:complete len:137 gc:universal NODE_1259_length_2726_cov_7.700112:292-702(+)